MDNSYSPQDETARQDWHPSAVVDLEPTQQNSLVRWWFDHTTPNAVSADASFVKREIERKARLTATVTFFLLATMVLFIPATILMSVSTFCLDLVIIALTIAALAINKAGRVTVASLIIVITFEVGLAVGIVLITPMDDTGLQLYDLFIIGELLAVSLLPIRSIFIVAIINTIFICIDLLMHTKVDTLAHTLEGQFLPALVRPIGLQFIVASIVFIWVSNAAKAIQRANRAEMIAALEHKISEQREVTDQENQMLEDSIQLLIKAHVDAANTQIISRIPYPPARILWPLVNVINTLGNRLQHAQQQEQELQKLRQVISTCAEQLQLVALNRPGSLPVYRTGTDLDPLLLSLRTLYNGPSHLAEPREREQF